MLVGENWEGVGKRSVPVRGSVYDAVRLYSVDRRPVLVGENWEGVGNRTVSERELCNEKFIKRTAVIYKVQVL